MTSDSPSQIDSEWDMNENMFKQDRAMRDDPATKDIPDYRVIVLKKFKVLYNKRVELSKRYKNFYRDHPCINEVIDHTENKLEYIDDCINICEIQKVISEI